MNDGNDIQWEADPCDLDLKGILTPQEYFSEISILNDMVSHAYAKPIDNILVVMSLLVFPLIPWGIRHRKRKTKHKKILISFLQQFNDKYQPRGVRMRWRRKPVSKLVIERFGSNSLPLEQQQIVDVEVQEQLATSPPVLVEAKLVEE